MQGLLEVEALVKFDCWIAYLVLIIDNMVLNMDSMWVIDIETLWWGLVKA